MKNKYLTRKDLLQRPNWDLTKVQGFAHDQVKKSDSGRGRPSYLYLQSRVEAFERGESVPSELEVANKLDKAFAITDKNDNELLAALDRVEALPTTIAPKAPSIHASVFNAGPTRVSVVRPELFTTIAALPPKHSPLKFEPTPHGQIKKLRLVVVDAEGRESLVQTPIVVD